MNRNAYDSDITTWSPQGRLHQIEYAMEAVKQGSAAVGLRSNKHARSSSDLASYQKKLIRIDDHMGIAIAGLTSDARVLSTYMRTESMRSRMVFGRPLPVQRIANMLGDKAQINTQRYGRRPYGVGLLIIGVDETGPHLYEFSPSGNAFDYYAVSIGARSQSAKTYLEKHFEKFAESSLDELVAHGLRALRDTLQQDKELTVANCSVGIVSKDQKFTVVEGEALRGYLDALNADGGSGGGGAGGDDAGAAADAGAGEEGDGGAAPMETE
ncbi:20S proteasome subunit alpha 6 [Zopfochytrium polystomum]|nr:20S proteasome subunit alpha 6 [Zopfochytrium polystomum]